MKSSAIIFLFLLLISGCKQNHSVTEKVSTSKDSKVEDTAITNYRRFKTSFENIDQIINSENYSTWMNINPDDSSTSLRIIFSLNEYRRDTLTLEYSQECYLDFPYRKQSGHLEVLFDTLIDSKYDFNIVKKILASDKSYHGKPFIILKLVNETTLQASYPFPELIQILNSADSTRKLFPDSFNLLKQDIQQ